jgi:hypothetical protein
MEMSVKTWVSVWAKTLIVTPLVFLALVVAAALIARAINDPRGIDHDTTFVILAALPRLLFYAAQGGAIVALPTLILGIPAALILERLQTTTFLTYAFVGLTIGAACAFGLAQWNDPNSTFAMIRITAPIAAVYGLLTAVTFRTLSRRKPARPAPAVVNHPKLEQLEAPADVDE